MTTFQRVLAGLALLLVSAATPSAAVELKVTRDALERTLKQQLFSGPDGRYYLKGNAQSACSVYVENPQLSFVQIAGEDRIAVRVKTHAKLGKAVRGVCIGIALNPSSEVSLAPDGEGETIGFRDAKIDHISDQAELNFILAPFLNHQLPSGMKVNAADLLRKALEGSTATSGYKVSLDRLKIHSIQMQGETMIVDFDGDLSVK
jgi:hypothetical protein